MVCMSETKDPKPSPDPVLLCMKKVLFCFVFIDKIRNNS